MIQRFSAKRGCLPKEYQLVGITNGANTQQVTMIIL